MAENVQRSVEVPVGLTVFSGLVTELGPSDLPEGVSPDNQDVIYLPGSVSSRPGLHKQYPQLGTNTITFIKSYAQPSRTVLNLILDSSGQLWKEDVFNAPRVLVPLVQVSPGSYCSSTTAFGKEYLAFHDGTTPTDIPMQFDGQYLDRVTQDGPAAPPNAASVAVQSVLLASVGPGTGAVITAMNVSDPELIQSPDGGNINDIGLTPPDRGSGIALSIDNGTNFVTYITIYNYILVTTATPHGMAVGSRLSIAGMTPAFYNSAYTVAIVVDAFNFKVSYGDSYNPGPATVFGNFGQPGTTLIRSEKVVSAHCASNHNLVVGSRVTISDIPNVDIDTIASISRNADGVVTVTTTNSVKITPGATMNISGVSDASFNGVITVLSVDIAAKKFTFGQSDITPAVVAGSGIVQDIWTGSFLVTSTPTLVDFTYTQVATNSTNNIIGTVTPNPFMSGGVRNIVCFFQTRQGYLTKPSEPVAIVSIPGQLVFLSNIPIGPPNVVARVIGITGADGSKYFVIPTLPNGGGTATLIPDNTTTSAWIDFSDNTLFDATAIDITGNNLFNQRVMRGALGFVNYASRLFTWGDHNRITNLLNMGFDGGQVVTIANPTGILGWTPTVGYAGGTLCLNGVRGWGWQITGGPVLGTRGPIDQSAYQDWLGVPILRANTEYTFRLWANRVSGNSGTLYGRFTSPSAGILCTAIITISDIPAGGGFVQAQFDAFTPAVIPPDTIFEVAAVNQANGDSVVLDEMQVIYSSAPVLLGGYGSYVNNPEAFDSVSGLIGPAEDNSAMRCAFVFRNLLHFLTYHGFHSTQDNKSTEPAFWAVDEITLVCGAASPRSVDVAENFVCWVSSPSSVPPAGRGLYVYEGGAVYKVSQEVQELFDEVNPLAEPTIWVKNDPVTRRIYCGLPVNSATAPNLIVPLDYRELNMASEIADKAPIRISFTGKMICSDLCRKWTKWNIAANCGELFVQPDHTVQFSIGGGNGFTPNTVAGFGNVYWMDPAKLADDDYGTIVPYYVTYFFVGHEAEQALQLGMHRKLFKRYSCDITGVGNLVVIPYANSLNNPYPQALAQPLNLNGNSDQGGGLNVRAERCAFKLSASPLQGTNTCKFIIRKFIPTLMQEPVAPISHGAV